MEVRDESSVWQHHGQRQDPDQGQHQADGETLGIWPDKCLVSVNDEGKETQHDGIAGKVLGIVSDKWVIVKTTWMMGRTKQKNFPRTQLWTSKTKSERGRVNRSW